MALLHAAESARIAAQVTAEERESALRQSLESVSSERDAARNEVNTTLRKYKKNRSFGL